MQGKSKVSSETIVADMHFAVVPYEIEFLVPKDEVYQIYFQKGLQILGTTQYPIENHQITKKVQLPIANNIITFRLFSERNSQYQWSIYKRVDEMQEFLETKKINLKDIMKKQPQKRIESQKRNFERKQSMIPRKGEVKSSELKTPTTKASELKTLESKTNDIKGLDQNSIQRFSEMSSEGKGCIYDEQIKSDLGQFVLKFYVFKALSNSDLNRAIEQKCRQKKVQRKLQQEINTANKVAELQRISEISANIQDQVQIQTKVLQEVEQAKEEHIQPHSVVQKQNIDQKIIVEETNEAKQQQELIPTFYQEKIEITPEQKNDGYIQFVEERQAPQVQLTSQKILQQTPIINAESPFQKGQNADTEQAKQIEEQQVTLETTVEVVKTPTKFSMGKKMFIFGLILMIVLYGLYSFNVFDKLSFPAKKESPKKGKKQKFSNRKKASK